MRKLECDRPLGLEKDRKPRNERIQVRHLREDVVAQHEIRLFSGGAQLAGGSLVEEPDQRLDASRLGGLGYVGRRLDAQAWDPPLDEILLASSTT